MAGRGKFDRRRESHHAHPVNPSREAAPRWLARGVSPEERDPPRLPRRNQPHPRKIRPVRYDNFKPLSYRSRYGSSSAKARSAAVTVVALTVPRFVYTNIVKLRDLEERLTRAGWWFLRRGGNHDVWTDGDRHEAIPRHREINERLAEAILRRIERKPH